MIVNVDTDILVVLSLDSFLRSRDKADHEVTAMMKAQFMSLWDGETCF